MKIYRFIPTEQDMLAIAATVAKHCFPGTSIYLEGNLGAGKTTFVRGFLRSLGYRENVKSPTYTLVELYELGSLQVYHLDLYRLDNELDLEHIGLSDYLTSTAICLIEWPEKAKNLLPTPSLHCRIEIKTGGRAICFMSQDQRGDAML